MGFRIQLQLLGHASLPSCRLACGLGECRPIHCIVLVSSVLVSIVRKDCPVLQYHRSGLHRPLAHRPCLQSATCRSCQPRSIESVYRCMDRQLRFVTCFRQAALWSYSCDVNRSERNMQTCRCVGSCRLDKQAGILSASMMLPTVSDSSQCMVRAHHLCLAKPQ